MLIVGSGASGLACALALSSKEPGNVSIVGEAAHSQSPVGGQGLNLAVWNGVTLFILCQPGWLNFIQPNLLSFEFH